jgi:hypothetical protein
MLELLLELTDVQLAAYLELLDKINTLEDYIISCSGYLSHLLFFNP